MKLSELILAPFVLAAIALAGFIIFCTVYGLYLAFSASILLGVVVLIVEPSPLVIGTVMLLFHKNLAQLIIDYLSK